MILLDLKKLFMYVFNIADKIRENILQVNATRIKPIAVSKIANFSYCREIIDKNEQVINKNI